MSAGIEAKPDPKIDAETHRWWTFLRGASVVNGALLAATGALVPIDSPIRAAQIACAAIYVAVCAFRSFFPRVDLERTVLVDHPLSSIALGRSAATVAELAFTAQCALFVDALAGGVGWRHAVAIVLVPLIAFAQGCCWLGVLTLDHRWHAAEEALWTVAMALLAVAFGTSFTAASPTVRAALILGGLACMGAAYVMAVVDIPMYLRRARDERAAGTPTLTVAAGVVDAVHRRHPTGAWAVWRREVLWMTPYFSVAVWISLALVWLA
jgi:hypothetical protein